MARPNLPARSTPAALTNKEGELIMTITQRTLIMAYLNAMFILTFLICLALIKARIEAHNV